MFRTAAAGLIALAALQAAPASAATFLFVRHAESTANAGTATTVAESLDPPLTALGQQQAIDLAATLAGRDITTIYTSAYQRTQKTIAPTAAEFGLTPTADARTNEWYLGDITAVGDIDYAQVYAVMGAWAAGDTSARMSLPNAESLDDMVARVVPAWTEIIDAHKDEDGVVVLVGHGAEMGYVMPFFAQNVSLGFAFGHGLHNTGIIELEVIGDRPYVTNWQGTPLPVPSQVPLPASGLLLLAGAGALAARGAAKRPAARA